MSNTPYRLTLALLCFGSSLHLASCSSKYRSGGNSIETTSSGLPGLGGTTTTAPGTGGTSPTGGGSGGSGGSEANMGGTTNVNGSGGTGAGGSESNEVGGTTSIPSAGAAGETAAGGSGAGGDGTGGDGTGGTGGGGSGGTSSVDMHCEPDAADCVCDDTGCFLIEGASCTQAVDCKTQICGVTQAASNVCCADACESDQVCSDDGSQCEAADVCEDERERCNASGNHQICVDGQWDDVENCGGRGCSIELTEGCLGDLGDACAESGECGVGTCQETDDGSEACCDASCGACLVCNQQGDSCVDPPTPKAGCECTQADASNCNDGIPCTDDSCVDGGCVNDLESGVCLIDGECIDHNAQEPGNPCRYCDSVLRDRAWTNSSNTVSCDDSLWCTGADTCNGSGQCQHQFPTSDRCTESGKCALTTCDEDRDSCYEPNSVVCDTRTEERCEPGNACGSDVQTQTITTKCSGSSPACDGEESKSTWADSTACGGNQKCNSSGFWCEDTLGCGDTWCDPSGTNLCWTLTEPEQLNFADATAYCNSLTAGGLGAGSWRLPTIEEWLRVSKGCDDTTGETHDESFQSTCTYDPEGDTFTPCEGLCPDGGGPTGGCYWPSAMGPCQNEAYWSSTVGTGTLWFNPHAYWVVSLSNGSPEVVRCVTEN